MKITRVLLASVVSVQLFTTTAVRAAETYEYPELLVTPRASDRIELEAKREAESRWTTHLPIQVSALGTLAAGIIQSGNTDPAKDSGNYSPWAGIVVGAGWLAATTIMAYTYTPYATAQKDLAEMPKKTQREQLTRERFAEEAIQKQARTARVLTLLSVVTNAAANTYMLIKADGNSFSIPANAVALALSFAPVLFRYHWCDVANEQADYKKRIYAPVASGGLLVDPANGKAVPGLLLSLRF